MWNWLRRQVSGHKSAPPQFVADHRPVPTPSAPSPAASPGAAADTFDPAFVSWLTEAPPAFGAPKREDERLALQSIDALMNQTQGVGELVPRAPAVVPQLLSALRQCDQSVPALVARVSKDLQLVAEVMRLARSAAYTVRGEVLDLAHAIAALGEHGLQRAIDRVVLRPLLHDGGGALSARAAPRLWDHTEIKSGLCGAKASAAGLDPFDAYLAGMMHSAGWTSLLRRLDRGATLARPWTRVFVEQLVARRDPLFGNVVGTWGVSAGIAALAGQALSPGLACSDSALARLLLDSDREASAMVLRALPAGAAAS